MGKAKEIARLTVPVFLGVLLAALVILGAWSLMDTGEEVEPTEAQWLYARWHDFQSSAVTDTNGAALGASGLSMLGIEVAGITTATVEFEGTIIGTTYYDLYAMNVETRAWVTSTTSDGYFALPLLGTSQVRCPITGYSGGTIDVKGDASPVGAMDPGAVSAILAAATDPTYIGDINFGESLPAGSAALGTITVTTVTTGTINVGAVAGIVTADVTGQGDVPITLDGETLAVSSNVAPAGKAASTSYTHDPGIGNTAAQIELAAPGSGVAWVVGGIDWSYNASPTAGGITLEDETGIVWQWDITAAGPGFKPWDPPLKLAANDMVTATLVAAGSGVTGTINLHVWSE